MEAARKFNKEAVMAKYAHAKSTLEMATMAMAFKAAAESAEADTPPTPMMMLNVTRERESAVACTKAVEDLERITLKEMGETDKMYKGKVLIGKLCAEPFKMTAVFNVLEDGNGHALTLSIYDHPPRIRIPEDMYKTYRRGRKVAVKEPYLVLSSDGVYSIRIDDHSNLVFL